MKELVILSGKGGTGKTSLTASFATLANGCMLCDADVDAADLHLLMQPDIRKQTDFQTDGPPGVGGPVIASLGGATSALIVAEPTVSGIHDMARAIDLCGHFKAPVMMCINTFDLNLDKSATIEKVACVGGLPVVGRIPFDQAFTRAMMQGKTLLEFDGNGLAGDHLREVWTSIMSAPAMTAE